MVDTSDESTERATQIPHPNPREILLPYFRGTGIEIGALHAPFPKAPPPTTVRYVDKFDLEELRRRNPDVPPDRIVPPDVVADSHDLAPIRDRSVDFVVASHVVEHLHNPIAALLEWHRVLVPGGRLLCVVPDARFTFDAGRPLTTLDHLLWDFVNPHSALKRLSDLFHVAECNLNMHAELGVESALELADTILSDSYDTHFHVWTFDSFHDHIDLLARECGIPFDVEESVLGEAEFAVVLRATDRSRLDISRSVPQAAR